MSEKRNLGIAYSVRAKKMAKGGKVKGVHEEAFSGDHRGESIAGLHLTEKKEDNKFASKERGRALHKDKLNELKSMPKPNIKGLAEGGEVSEAPMIRRETRKGLKTTPIKHPRMVESAFSTKLRSDEDHLEQVDHPEAPQKDHFDRIDAEMHDVHHEDDAKAPEHVEREPHYELEEEMMAEGGEVEFTDSEPQDEIEQEKEHHASIAAAVMAKRRKMMADGGVVDLDLNAEEEPANPDTFDKRNQAAAKENYDEDMHSMVEPHESLGDAHEMSEENKEDAKDVSRIKRIMSRKSPIIR